MGESRGAAFYDDHEVHARYLSHHQPNRFSPNHVMEEPAVLDVIGDPSGLRVIDLGCGDGRFGKYLLDAGCASYLGIDGSRAMAARAALTLAGGAGQVQLGDLEDFAGPPGAADLVTARLALHYVDDLRPVIAAAAGALSPGGRFVMTVVHPVVTSHDTPSAGQRTTWTVDDYFVPGPRRRAWLGAEVVWHHRTVEDYVQALTAAGLTLTDLRECAPVAERFEDDREELSRRRRVPLFLLLSGRI